MTEQSRSYQIGDLTLEIVEGDITTVDTEAIANAANSALWMGSGVAGAIKAAGGVSIEEEAVSRGPIEVGQAIATSAGRLPFRYVIHGAVMGPDLRTNGDLIAETTRSCLQLAEQLGLQSLALPAFGTGVGGFSLTRCAQIMIGAVKEFADSAPQHLHRVVFCLFGAAAFETFVSTASQVLA